MDLDARSEAKKLSKLIRRKKHCHLTRPIGSALAILLVIMGAEGIGLAIGAWPAWLIVAGVLLSMLAGLIGEAFARAWEKRGASEEEVVFANQFMWALEDTIEVNRTWEGDRFATRMLSMLAQYAPDESIAEFAKKSTLLLSSSSVPSAISAVSAVNSSARE